MDDMIKEITFLTDRITIIRDDIKEKKSLTARVLEMKLKHVSECREECLVLQKKCFLKATADTKDVIWKSAADFEEVATSTEICITNLLDECSTSVYVSNSDKNAIRLPKLELPTFSGGYTEWQEFIDIFNCAVHDRSDLSDTQKLQYLKACIKGEASKIIKSISLIGSNYKVALDMLKGRYANKKSIRDAHFYALFGTKAITKSAQSI